MGTSFIPFSVELNAVSNHAFNPSFKKHVTRNSVIKCLDINENYFKNKAKTFRKCKVDIYFKIKGPNTVKGLSPEVRRSNGSFGS